MDRRGFSLIELLIVIVILGALAAFGFPRMRQGMEARRVSGARIAITGTNAKARALAVQRSRTVKFVVSSNVIKLVSTDPVTGAVTVTDERNLYDVFGVTVTPSRDTMYYDPRGLGLQNSTTDIVVSRPGGFADTVFISSLGGILQ